VRGMPRDRSNARRLCRRAKRCAGALRQMISALRELENGTPTLSHSDDAVHVQAPSKDAPAEGGQVELRLALADHQTGQALEDSMSIEHAELHRTPVILGPGEGRRYGMGRISAVFKADEKETGQRYSISEWWLEPNTQGPGAHSHPEDDVFYVIEGIMSVLVGERWSDAAAGSFVLVPGGITHDFENRGAQRAGVLNFSIPGNFEAHMPGIVDWFAQHPPSDAQR